MFLPDLIDEDQIAFLSMRCILDNILVQIETIEWCKESQHSLILLKLEFKRAYDIVNLGIPSPFIDMVKVLFTNVEVCESP